MKKFGIILFLGITCITFMETNKELLKKFHLIHEEAYYEFNYHDGTNSSLGKAGHDMNVAYDKLLNEKYQKTIKTLNETDKTNLQNAQRSWIKMKDLFRASTIYYFDKHYFGREGQLILPNDLTAHLLKSKILFLNTYENKKQNEIDENIENMFHYGYDKTLSIKELDHQLNEKYKILKEKMEAFIDDSNERDKNFTDASQKLTEAQREWIKYRDLTFAFIDKNNNFSKDQKELLKKTIYIEILIYYDIYIEGY